MVNEKEFGKKGMVLLVGGGEGGGFNEIINESLQFQDELDNLIQSKIKLHYFIVQSDALHLHFTLTHHSKNLRFFGTLKIMDFQVNQCKPAHKCAGSKLKVLVILNLNEVEDGKTKNL